MSSARKREQNRGGEDKENAWNCDAKEERHSTVTRSADLSLPPFLHLIITSHTISIGQLSSPPTTAVLYVLDE